MTEHEEYCVSIRESYRMSGSTLVGYVVTLWRWNPLDETWWFAAIRDYLFVDYNGSRRKALRQAKSCGPWSKLTERGLIEHHA